MVKSVSGVDLVLICEKNSIIHFKVQNKQKDISYIKLTYAGNSVESPHQNSKLLLFKLEAFLSEESGRLVILKTLVCMSQQISYFTPKAVSFQVLKFCHPDIIS